MSDRSGAILERAPGPVDAGPSPAPGAPGDAHAESTLAAMLLDPVRDTVALAGSPVDALVLGCGEGRLAQRLIEWGVDRVTGVDTRPDLLARARILRAQAALPPDCLRLVELDALDPASAQELGRCDLVVIELEAARLAEISAVLRLAHLLTTRLCAIDTADRVLTTTAAREAGFERVELSEVPVDAERRFILVERALLLARPASAG